MTSTKGPNGLGKNGWSVGETAPVEHETVGGTATPDFVDAETPLVGPLVKTATGGSGSVMMRQAVAEATQTLCKVGDQIDAIVGLLAASGFDRTVVARHERTLSHLLKKRTAALTIRVRHRRTAWMEKTDLESVPPSKLGQPDLHPSGDRIQQLVDGAMESPRRVVVRGGDRATFTAYAESTNPTTAYLDLPHGDVNDQIDPTSLGRTLGGLHQLSTG